MHLGDSAGLQSPTTLDQASVLRRALLDTVKHSYSIRLCTCTQEPLATGPTRTEHLAVALSLAQDISHPAGLLAPVRQALTPLIAIVHMHCLGLPDKPLVRAGETDLVNIPAFGVQRALVDQTTLDAHTVRRHHSKARAASADKRDLFCARDVDTRLFAAEQSY